MDNKFIVKFQKIGSIKEGNTTSFCAPLIIEPEDKVSIRRGFLYSTIEAMGPTEFDPNLIVKVITDTLRDEYFSNHEGTPLSCLERAIIILRDKVFNLLSDPKAPASGTIEFHTVVSVLWGNVLYVVQYGTGCSYLVREGRIKPINASSEGNFSVASGVVKDGDIVVLGSKAFCEKYSPESLLAASSSSFDSVNTAAVILKFYVEKEAKEYQAEQRLDIRDPLAKNIRVNRGNGFNPYSKRRVLAVASLLLAALFIFSVASAFRKNVTTTKTTTITVAISKVRENIEEAKKHIGTDDERARALLTENQKLLESIKGNKGSDEITKLKEENDATLDLVNKVARIEDSPYYDLRIDDKDVNPSEIAVSSKEGLLVADNGRSKLYKLSFVSSPSANIVESSQGAKPKFLYPTENGAVFMGEGAFYEYDGGNSKIRKMETGIAFPLIEISASGSYLGNIYLVRGEKILKNTFDWTSDELLRSATSLAVDGSIYVLTSSGSVLKYTSGTKEQFSLKGLDKPLSQPSQIYTSPDLENLYVLDKGNLRVAVFDKTGKLKVQYVPKPFPKNFTDLRSISVSRDEKTLILLSGTKIFKASINIASLTP